MERDSEIDDDDDDDVDDDELERWSKEGKETRERRGNCRMRCGSR
jgi:hypothetical protein